MNVHTYVFIPYANGHNLISLDKVIDNSHKFSLLMRAFYSRHNGTHTHSLDSEQWFFLHMKKPEWHEISSETNHCMMVRALSRTFASRQSHLMYHFGIALFLLLASHFVSFDKYMYIVHTYSYYTLHFGWQRIHGTVYLRSLCFELDRKKIQWTAVLFSWKMRRNRRERALHHFYHLVLVYGTRINQLQPVINDDNHKMKHRCSLSRSLSFFRHVNTMTCEINNLYTIRRMEFL